jgi:predicted SAM-dependent methyltransferase
LIDKNSETYYVLKWCYQPIKAAKYFLMLTHNRQLRSRLIRQYLKRPGFKALQIGCGPFRIDGWLNSDLPPNARADFYMDITRGLPFPDGCLDAIYGEEVIEHLDRPGAANFLREACRILRPGGVIRLTTPDVTLVCRAFLGIHDQVTMEDCKKVWIEAEPFTSEIWINAAFRYYGHQWVYTYDGLKATLLSAGFSDVKRCDFKKSGYQIAQLNGLEFHTGPTPPPWAGATTLILEARNGEDSTPRKLTAE